VKFIPAIDLKDNKCVRLKRGKEENLTISLRKMDVKEFILLI
jgi:phosphoribosylformimino-5-aminoimidazole carboxamide ribonucleotide (ProFAR) isomerase